MLILAIVSGLGDLRISSKLLSKMGDDGAEDGNGREALFNGSGLLKGAGFEEGAASAGGGGRR